jgi:hypothetical protein
VEIRDQVRNRIDIFIKKKIRTNNIVGSGRVV